MVAMARKRTTATTEQPDNEPDRRKAGIMSFRPGATLRETVEHVARTERRSASQMIELLLEEALEHRGLWPPQDES